MRYSAPRSLSPPSRRRRRKEAARRVSSNSFRCPSESEDSSDDDSAYSDGSDSDSSTESIIFHPPRPPPRILRSPSEQRYNDELVASVQLRANYRDPYVEWGRNARKEACDVVRRANKASCEAQELEKERKSAKQQQLLDRLHKQQMFEITNQLEQIKTREAVVEGVKQTWKRNEDLRHSRMERGIQIEERKLAAKLEEERKMKEEEERLRAIVLEKKKQEEEAKRAKAEEEERQRQQREEEDRLRAARLEQEKQQRAQLGLTTAEEDWREARRILITLKTETMKTVKGDAGLKAEWGKWRRQITPKIGQITNDEAEINRISTQIHQIFIPPNQPPHNPLIYTALLSSLSKAIILQAETEVTAEKKSAVPISKVAFNLLSVLEGFAEVFFAKIMQRVGGWPVPSPLPAHDVDGRPWADEAEKNKMRGYRKSPGQDSYESDAEFTIRAAGIMRVYFGVLKIAPVMGPLKPMFQMPRIWTWLARMLSDQRLLGHPVAAELIYTALDVMGSEARDVWGHQFIKLLALAYDGVHTGFAPDKFIGGTTPEGKAARVRVELEIERIIRG